MHLLLNYLAPTSLGFLMACSASAEQAEPTIQEGAPSSAQTTPLPSGTQIPLLPYPGAPYEDTKGNLWFGSVGEGIVRFDGKEFVTFGPKEGLASNVTRGFMEHADGTLWIATSGGVSLFDGKAFRTLTNYGEIDVTRTFDGEGDHRDIWDIVQDRSGTVWIATLNGVFRYEDSAFVRFPLPVESPKGAYEFAPKMVYSIFEDKKGRLWFGTDGSGAVCADGEAMTVYTVESHGLCSNRVCKMLEDSRGDFWFGTSDGGISRWSRDTDGDVNGHGGDSITTHLRSATFSKHSGWGRFMAIHEDRDGGVWFGSSSPGGGAHRFDGKAFRHYSAEDGLGSGGVPSIKSDRQGNLWFGTTAGVFSFDGKRFIRRSKEK